jgi:hypothetical protein
MKQPFSRSRPVGIANAAPAARGNDMLAKQSIVFVHRLWADGSCFTGGVIPSHVPLLSQPNPALDVIRTAASSVLQVAVR